MTKSDFILSSHIKKALPAIILAFGTVMFWRGSWHLMDLYLVPENPVASNLISFLAGVIILFFIKDILESLKK